MQLMARLSFLRRADEKWPDISLAAIARRWEEILVPVFSGRRSLSEITANDLAAIFDIHLSWELRQELDQKVPTHFTAPTGNRFAIHYEGERAPSVAVRVQELYGLTRHPAIADGRLPADPGIAVTGTAADPGDARSSRLLGRILARRQERDEGALSKHVWPEDPAGAAPTSRAKPHKS